MTPSEALQFLRNSLPADRGLDGERDTAIRTLAGATLCPNPEQCYDADLDATADRDRLKHVESDLRATRALVGLLMSDMRDAAGYLLKDGSDPEDPTLVGKELRRRAQQAHVTLQGLTAWVPPEPNHG